jgi:Asp-tRNA(Asn)/Glu-tRNA(Gln) amidotransferase A subunit family amidase
MTLYPVTLPETPAPTGPILNAEAAAAFDELTRTGGVDQMVRQGRNAWPNSFRYSRFIPAVEYINANRTRTLLMQEMAKVMGGIDVLVTPSFRGGILGVTNLTGHPCVVAPNRFDPIEGQEDSPRRSPGSISFIGGLYKDDLALAVAHRYQDATDFHRRRPPIR